MADSLTFEDFETLSTLAACGKPECAAQLLDALEQRGLVRGASVTDDGFAALEPYRVKRAVVMAAGFGSRMVPVTYETPKPLVRVNGKRIIDTVLEALVSAGIRDIFIVRGYLAEQFDELVDDYPAITFIENPGYANANNISSIVAARDYLAGSYVCEADLVLRKPSLITPYQYRSNYLGAPVAHTDDWCFKTDDDLRITDLLVGADDCHHMYGISYWTPEDGARLGADSATVFEEPGGSQRYWDEVALRAFAGQYAVYVRECAFEDVLEIDTFDELVSLDPMYASLQADKRG